MTASFLEKESNITVQQYCMLLLSLTSAGLITTVNTSSKYLGQQYFREFQS